jgi:hypothetical protein
MLFNFSLGFRIQDGGMLALWADDVLGDFVANRSSTGDAYSMIAFKH